jgi:hypothetical protein
MLRYSLAVQGTATLRRFRDRFGAGTAPAAIDGTPARAWNEETWAARRPTLAAISPSSECGRDLSACALRSSFSRRWRSSSTWPSLGLRPPPLSGQLSSLTGPFCLALLLGADQQDLRVFPGARELVTPQDLVDHPLPGDRPAPASQRG